MIGLILRLFYLVWFVGLLGLSIATLADLLLGRAPFAERLGNLLPRLVVAILWPLAAVTSRGRHLLWARWQHQRES